MFKKYGLVLAGGGAKGAYQLGAWKALREMHIRFNAIAGVSIGSINGALIAQGDYKKALEMWQNVSVDKGIKISEELPDEEYLFSKKNWSVLLREFLKNGGFDASPTKEFLLSYIDEEKIRKKKIPLGLVTVQMNQGVKPLEFFLEDIPEGKLVDYLLASSSIPLANNIGPDGEKFLDGGIYDNTPVMTLKKRGYNRLIVIDISNIKGVAHNLNFRNSKVVYIRPYDIDDLGPAFNFDEEMIDRRIKMGYLDTRKAFGCLLGDIYYFKPDVYKKMAAEFTPDTLANLELLAHELKVEKIRIYTRDDFISAVKYAYENAKEEDFEKERGLDFDRLKSAIFKRYSSKKETEQFSDALALLDNLIS